MARHENVKVAQGAWTELTNADTSTIAFYNRGPSTILVEVTAGATPPSDTSRGFRYERGQGEANISLSTLAPGIAGTRVYAYSEGAATDVMVSHG